jgi:amino acid transporter
MNRRLQVLHGVNIISFLLLVVYIYFWQHQVLLSFLLGLEITVFVVSIYSTIKLWNHGEDEDRKKLFKKSWWLALYSLIFIGIYFFITYR